MSNEDTINRWSTYLLTFIDDMGLLSYLYKSKTFGKFKEFKAFIEKQSGLPYQDIEIW